MRLLFALLHCFGLSVNREKSDFRPRRVREHLGILVDLKKFEFSVPPRKLCNLQNRARALAARAAAHRRWVPKQELASFVGYVISLSVAIPLARFHLLPLYDAINSNPLWAPFVHVRLSSGAYRKLKFYFSNIPVEDLGSSILPTSPTECLFTDASSIAWGAHLSSDV